MKIGILSRKAELYSTNRLCDAAHARGHKTEVINYARCYITIEKGKPRLHYQKKSLSNFDAIIPRIGASYTFFGTAVVRQFEMMGVFTVNPSQAIVRSRDKLRAHQILSGAVIDMPSTGFARSINEVDEVVHQVGGFPVILKLIEGTHGSGVVLVESRRQAKSTLDAFYSLKTQILIQEFIAESGGADVRVFVVDGKAVGAMRRTAAEGDFRSNLHKGGSAKVQKLSRKIKSAAEKSAKALGLNMAGVDLVESERGPLVLEVNSSPGLQGIEKATGLDIAGNIIDFIESHAGSKRKRDTIRA
ncbi:MAG: 30S ribosomal protein S6--L-glutamate ligase [SAR324 cluster bacterium]|nr:30S ribosomal protein S6--L-glutamate ligase [SAR324 cluster bacterium]